MKSTTILLLVLASGVGAGLLLFFNPYAPFAYPPGGRVLMQEQPLPGSGPAREGVVLPARPCDPVIWLGYPRGDLRGERLLCGALPPSVWRQKLQEQNVDPERVHIRSEGWRVEGGDFEIPTSSPRPFYVRIFWILAFGVVLIGLSRKYGLVTSREALAWAVFWGGLSVFNRLQMLPGLQGLEHVERRAPHPMHEIFLAGPFWAVLLLEVLALWVTMGWAMERLRRTAPSLVQDLILMFRGRPPRWVGGSVFLGAGLALLWWIPWTGWMARLPDMFRFFPDPFLLAGWVPGLHLFHRAFEMAFLLMGLWLILLAVPRLPEWVRWGFLVLLGAGPLFALPLGWGGFPFLYRLTAGGLAALTFGAVLLRFGALSALSFALFAWMVPGSLFLLKQGSMGVVQVAGVWGIPLLLAGVAVLRGEKEVLLPYIPRLDEDTLRALLANLTPESFRDFLVERGWSERPLWWKLALLVEEVYGVPVDLETSRKEVVLRIPAIRMVQEGVRRILECEGELEDGLLRYTFPREAGEHG